MPNFAEMLRASSVFNKKRPLGMPEEEDDYTLSEMLRKIIPLTSSLKNDDVRRQKDMMQFQHSLRNQQPQQSGVPLPPPKRVVFGGVHPPTAMQQQFRQDDVAARTQRDRMATLGATQTGALNNALITGKQRDDANMARTVADINGRSQVAQMNKELAAKAADDARTDKASMDAKARLEKGPLVNVADPKDPTKMISVRHNPATNKYERVMIGDDQAGTGYKQGTIPKPTVNPGQDPAALKAARETSQSIINELNLLLDDKGELKQHTADAVGKSRMIGNVANYFGAGSLTPSTTKGRAGIDTLKGKLVLEQIGKLKRQSKTGATGFGAMNQKELAILEAAASKLNATDMSDNDYKDELNRIRMALQKVMEDSTGEDDSGSNPSGGSSDADKRAEDYMRRKGLM